MWLSNETIDFFKDHNIKIEIFESHVIKFDNELWEEFIEFDWYELRDTAGNILHHNDFLYPKI